jgi:hypothetical protein
MSLLAQDADDQEAFIPEKLLDAPIINVKWPEEFDQLGHALRLDYSTDLHNPQGESYTHRFTTGVKIYWPYQDYSDLDEHFGSKPAELPEPFDPMMLGYKIGSADRLYLITSDGRQMIFTRKDLPVVDEHANESFMVGTLDPSIVVYDPENNQLLIMPKGRGKKEPLFVIRGGGMHMTTGGMIVG